MNLFPAPSCQRRQEQYHDDGSKTLTLHLDSAVVTVTCNRPSPAALDKFTHTLHEILLNMVDDKKLEN